MACRELRLPAGVSVLHVEQEVTGDNTLALDSVLECDTERVQLLAREGELLASGDKDTAGRCVPGEGGVVRYFPVGIHAARGLFQDILNPKF